MQPLSCRHSRHCVVLEKYRAYDRYNIVVVLSLSKCIAVCLAKVAPIDCAVYYTDVICVCVCVQCC